MMQNSIFSLFSFLKYFQIASTDIYNGYPKLKSAFELWSDRETLQDDVTANFKFQSLACSQKRVSQTLQISVDVI